MIVKVLKNVNKKRVCFRKEKKRGLFCSSSHAKTIDFPGKLKYNFKKQLRKTVRENTDMSTKITVTPRTQDETLVLEFAGKIDSSNAPKLEEDIRQIMADAAQPALILDFDKLKYTTSAGLRVILRLKQQNDTVQIINASPEVYDILEMTGFTDMMPVQKAFRAISVENCEVIGQGANGKVYRIDRDTIVKVYLNADALPEIRRERELARTAFVAGVPTAIPYDVVKIEGGGYGSVFELLNAESYAKLLASGKKTPEELAVMSVDLLKLIHSKTVKPGTMPDMKATAEDWVLFLKDYLPPEAHEKLTALVKAVPDDQHMMHGDYHIKNVMLQNDESLLIDMDTLCYGYPIFEFASMFNAYCGFSELDHSAVEKFLGIPRETSVAFWRRSLELYLDSTDDAVIRSVEDKARIIGYARIMRRSIRRNGLDTEEGRAVIENCRNQILQLLTTVDSLTF